jgi:hypothetical protein
VKIHRVGDHCPAYDEIREDRDTDRTAGDRLLDRQYGQEDEAIRDQRQRTAPKASVTKLRSM